MTSRAREHLGAAVLGCRCALASCTVGPDYAPPGVSVPAAWRKPGGSTAPARFQAEWATIEKASALPPTLVQPAWVMAKLEGLDALLWRDQA